MDPIGLDGGDTNMYRYVGNNPITRIDPFGRFWGAIVQWAAKAIVKQIVGYPIKKTFTDAPIMDEDEEVKNMYEDKRKKREKERGLRNI